MRILDRYVLRAFVHYLLIGLLLFVGLFVIVDLFEKIDKFVDNEASWIDVAQFYVYKIPYILVLTTPIAMLLASLLTLGQISRTGELGAMLSAGISFLRVVVPVLVLGVLVSALSFALAEWVMPTATVAHERIYEEKIRQGRGRPVARERHVTYMGRDDRLFYIKSVDPNRGLLRDVVVQRFDADKNVVERVDAREAEYVSGVWRFSRGTLRAGGVGESCVAFVNYWTSRIPETPEDFLREEPDPMNMGRTGLAGYIQRLKESRARTRKYEVEYHLKLAFPLVNAIIVLLGMSLAARIRRTGFALGFGLSIFVGFAYFACVRIGQAIGYNGDLPPLAAAWLGNGLFLLLAVAFQVRANR